MPTLEHDSLVFRFPATDPDARFSIDFQRTLRIPDSGRDYPLPPGFGRFPLRHVEDFPLPRSTAERGGVILPIWQAEALWLNFSSQGSRKNPWDEGGFPAFPVAIKVAAGKINAITGEAWRAGLHRDPQDYVVAPEQPWLDGFAIEPEVVRQFVAMPLGDGYSAEEQLTGEARWGGLQISVCPLKKEVWERRKRQAAFRDPVTPLCASLPGLQEMALAPGGRMRQSIEADPYHLTDWDTAQQQRVFVTLAHAKDWKALTGEPAPTTPPEARDYARAGLPWFEYYGSDRAPLPGGKALRKLGSVGTLHEQKTGVPLPGAQDVETGDPVGLSGRSVSAGRWED